MNDDQDSAAPREPAPKPTAVPPNFAEQFAWEALREQRLARRWGIFFKCVFLLYLFGILAASMPKLGAVSGMGGKKITALVDVEGVIADGSEASADKVVTGLRAAFDDRNTAGVIVRINSPGGSPVQAGYINDEIFRLKRKHPGIPVYAVIQDICASGGYYVATAADEIYADKASLVGSIGVRMDGFGFVDTMHKLGIERRLFTAGTNKGFLDPFSDLDPAHVEHVRKMLGEIHQQFINTVQKKRRAKLADDPELFSGLVWTGEKALELGLVDELGSTGQVAREVIGAEKIVDFTPRDYSVEGLLKRSGVAILSDFVAGGGWHW